MFKTERRKRLRFNMSLPISVFDEIEGLHIQGVTRDVSSSGASLFATTLPSVGDAVTFALDLPYELTLTEPVRIECTGRVARVEPQPYGGGVVVGVRRGKFEWVGFCNEEPS